METDLITRVEERGLLAQVPGHQIRDHLRDHNLALLHVHHLLHRLMVLDR